MYFTFSTPCVTDVCVFRVGSWQFWHVRTGFVLILYSSNVNTVLCPCPISFLLVSVHVYRFLENSFSFRNGFSGWGEPIHHLIYTMTLCIGRYPFEACTYAVYRVPTWLSPWENKMHFIFLARKLRPTQTCRLVTKPLPMFTHRAFQHVFVMNVRNVRLGLYWPTSDKLINVMIFSGNQLWIWMLLPEVRHCYVIMNWSLCDISDISTKEKDHILTLEESPLWKLTGIFWTQALLSCSHLRVDKITLNSSKN